LFRGSFKRALLGVTKKRRPVDDVVVNLIVPGPDPEADLVLGCELILSL
jgi:hypothetical protein